MHISYEDLDTKRCKVIEEIKVIYLFLENLNRTQLILVDSV